MSTVEDESPRGAGAAPRGVQAVQAVPEDLAGEFEQLGLSPYEARVTLALMRLGPANTLELSRVSRVPRTSMYQVLESLSARHLATRVPGEGPAVWAGPPRDEVLDRIHAAEEDRLREHRLRADRLRAALAQAFPNEPDVELPNAQLLHGRTEVGRTFERLWQEADTEVLAFSRHPYTTEPGKVIPAVVDAVRRGLVARALYESRDVDDPHSPSFRGEVDAYVEAGVQARVVDQLPIKLVVFDRRTTLVALTGPVVETGYPTNLLIEHPGYAEVQADAFEQRWSSARAYRRTAGAERPDTPDGSDSSR